MYEGRIYHSSEIFYEITEENNQYSLEVYEKGFRHSPDPDRCCKIEQVTDSIEEIEKFAQHLAHNCALPIHIPELTEDFLIS